MFPLLYPITRITWAVSRVWLHTKKRGLGIKSTLLALWSWICQPPGLWEKNLCCLSPQSMLLHYGSLARTHTSIVLLLSTSTLFLALQDAPGSSCVFPASVLESAIFPRGASLLLLENVVEHRNRILGSNSLWMDRSILPCCMLGLC